MRMAKQGRQDSNPRPTVLETAALTGLSYTPMGLSCVCTDRITLVDNEKAARSLDGWAAERAMSALPSPPAIRGRLFVRDRVYGSADRRHAHETA